MSQSKLEFLLTAVDKASGTFDTVGGKASGMQGRVKGAVTALGGMATAAGVVDFGRDSVAAFTEAEQSAQQLQFALDQFPATADTNAAKLGELNAQLALKTRYDDDAYASGQAVLAQFGLTGAQIEQLTPLLGDYAAKTGNDLPGAAESLGKAFMGNGKALKSLGIDFKDAGSVGANYDQVMAGLRSQVGGFAEQEGQTAAGTTERMKNAYGNLQEVVGSMLVPALTTMLGKGVEIAGWMQQHEGLVKAGAVVLGIMATAYGALSLAQTVSAGISAVRTLALGTETVATTAGTVATGGFAAAMWAATWPVLAVVAAIALVVGGAYLLITNWDKIGPWFKSLWNGIILAAKDAWRMISDGAMTAWQGVTAAFGTLTGWFSNLFGGFKAANSAVFNVLSDSAATAWQRVQNVFSGVGSFFTGIRDSIARSFREAFRAVAQAWNGSVGGIGFTVPDWVPGLGGRNWSIPDMPVPALAAGGIVTGPTLALIGEAGPEAVVPLDRMGATRPQIIQLRVDGRTLAEVVNRANLRGAW